MHRNYINLHLPSTPSGNRHCRGFKYLVSTISVTVWITVGSAELHLSKFSLNDERERILYVMLKLLPLLHGNLVRSSEVLAPMMCNLIGRKDRGSIESKCF